MHATSSPLLALFLEAQARLEEIKAERERAEKEARVGRHREQVAQADFSDAKRALEQLDHDPLDGLPTWDPPPDPPASQPAAAADIWRAVDVPDTILPILEMMRDKDVASSKELQLQMPELQVHIVRSRITNAKQRGLITSAGWGMYSLTPLGRRALKRAQNHPRLNLVD